MTITTLCFCHVCQRTHLKPGRVSSPASQVVNGQHLPVAAHSHHSQDEIRAAFKTFQSGGKR